MQNKNQQYRVDKTESLEKGIIVFPSIYIEGSAASGKTTAVDMLLERHAEVETVTFHMEQEAEETAALPMDKGEAEAVSFPTGRKESQADQFPGKLQTLLSRMEEKKIWVIFENIPCRLEKRVAQAVAELICQMPKDCRAILVSRERPQQEFLELFWKRKLELISCEHLFFSLEEIKTYVQHTGASLAPNEIYQKTGGWPGCVDVLIRLGLKNKQYGQRPGDLEELLGSYEMDAYIRREILYTLSPRERKMLTRAVSYPWLNEQLCREVWKTQDALQVLDILRRKSLLLYDREKNRWRAVPLFERYISSEKSEAQKVEKWYEKNGYIGEALRCLQQTENEEAYRTFLLNHYDKIPFLGVHYGAVMKWQEKTPEICYLRGMYSYSQQDMEGLDREIQNLKNHQPWNSHIQEIYLNLNYVKPDLHLNDWLQMLEDCGKDCGLAVEKVVEKACEEEYEQTVVKNVGKTCAGEYEQVVEVNVREACRKECRQAYEKKVEKESGKECKQAYGKVCGTDYRKKNARMRLYGILGNSMTFLCGLRDLSGLFACSKKEESHRARIWKEHFGATEWNCYRLARIDYYLETERRDAVPEEDWNLLLHGEEENTLESGNFSLQKEEENASGSWQISLARLYLLCKLQRLCPEENYVRAICELETALLQEDHPVCVRIAEAVGCLYSLWYQEREKLSQWLRYTLMDSTVRINEENYMMFFCRAKGYLLLNQYDRAGKILKKLIPYLQVYHRSRFLAELLFENAVVNLWENSRSQAVRNVVASFLVTGNSRYVEFYAGYGERGREVLEAYEEWMSTNSPESWHRKKKYNYGNVLRMPMEDYIGVVLRCARRERRVRRQISKEDVEMRLTMMETIILQDIGRGLSNAEICEELSLKLSTVKSHIYSLYKKLGVDSRMQAVLKGKELGVLD